MTFFAGCLPGPVTVIMRYPISPDPDMRPCIIPHIGRGFLTQVSGPAHIPPWLEAVA